MYHMTALNDMYTRLMPCAIHNLHWHLSRQTNHSRDKRCRYKESENCHSRVDSSRIVSCSALTASRIDIIDTLLFNGRKDSGAPKTAYSLVVRHAFFYKIWCRDTHEHRREKARAGQWVSEAGVFRKMRPINLAKSVSFHYFRSWIFPTE